MLSEGRLPFQALVAPTATPTIALAAPATQRTPVIAPLEPPIAAKT